MRADKNKLADVVRRLKAGEDPSALAAELYARAPTLAPRPAPSPPLEPDSADCFHLGQAIPGPERQARGLSHARLWRRCGLGLGQGGAVCPCLGCGPKCGQYHAPGPVGDSATPLPLVAGSAAAGVVIGTYGWPRLAEAQVLTIREMCGAATPILLADDGSPATADLARLAERLGVDFEGTLHRLGHYPGDLSVFRKGLEWAKGRGLAALAKLSMRLLITWPGWLQAAAELVLHGPAETVTPQMTEGSDRTLYHRTEAVAMRVDAWTRPEVMERLYAEKLGVTELHFNDIIQRNFGGRVLHWPGFTRDRYQRTEGVLWHCSHSPAEYAAWFARYGLQLDAGFYTAGHDRMPGWKAG